jgi:hypothetical protein
MSNADSCAGSCGVRGAIGPDADTLDNHRTSAHTTTAARPNQNSEERIIHHPMPPLA